MGFLHAKPHLLILELSTPPPANGFAVCRFTQESQADQWRSCPDWTPAQAASTATRHYLAGDREQLEELVRYLTYTCPTLRDLATDPVGNTLLRCSLEELQPENSPEPNMLKAATAAAKVRVRPRHFRGFLMGLHPRAGNASPVLKLSGHCAVLACAFTL